jgi:reactive intermediate/imine deaminase
VRLEEVDMLFISGQVSQDLSEVVVGRGDIVRQAEQVLTNLRSVVEAAGGTLRDVVKVTVFLRNMADRDAVADVRRRFFGDHLPASTLVEVSKLAHPDWLVEIEAIAIVQVD